MRLNCTDFHFQIILAGACIKISKVTPTKTPAIDISIKYNCCKGHSNQILWFLGTKTVKTDSKSRFQQNKIFRCLSLGTRDINFVEIISLCILTIT